ncbi:aspartate/glutamate racemase family protein [Pseudomonas extremaustralis]|uniref:Hydrogenase expression protein HupH n=3 Tax=Gammaproteobacteria TaxID=1236 RepID=A0A7Y1A2F7_PSEVE|nr:MULTISPECIES: aspartate/glutamate racemase family protein [Pseudomonas]MDB1112053.1 aspartate/glutamate racemase family protein [Pseudomonas extremaustralis]MDG2968010.1 aspartate/glutamate racemase family protein [Pseudomonas extremaustralis]NMY07895.1 hydrogenase expression protein HupH [Pseudomonas veronii]SKA88298.1 allantoin racemase [Pseudomonas extremaustralis]
MKKRIKMIFPVPMSEATRPLVESQLPASLMRPDIDVSFVGAGQVMTLADSYYDMALMELAVIEAGIKAEDEGYDAVCVNTVSDSGLSALRSRLSIPVLAPGIAAFHTACMLGQKFSILTMWPRWYPLYRKTLKEYGLEARLASIRSIDVRPDTQALLEGKEEVVFAKLLDAGRLAIEQDGADVIVLGSTTMHQAHAYLAEHLPVPVLNPGLIAYKMCEVLLDLGLCHSKIAYPSPEQIKDTAFSR